MHGWVYRAGAGGRVWLRLAIALSVCGAVVGLGIGFAASATRAVSAAPANAKAAAFGIAHPDVACAGCHREIYERYERTSMAQGSGLAVDGALSGGFRHAGSGISYQVFSRGGALWMSYEREAKPGSGAASALHGERRLEYFIGSGHRGRTYLYQIDGQWFELPINFYGKKEIWDMAPNFGAVPSMPAPLPVDSNCLHCHASEVKAAMPEARNRYAGAPFGQGGVGCSGCHGDASRHLAAGGHGPIVNPGKLAPGRRDDTCLQCHLEGDAVVYRPGRSLAQFRPGDRLDEDALYFVRASAEAGGRRATSQYEALLRSACKAGSGDRLTCTTCHDPHGTPAAGERVAYFRARCLSCHTGAAIAEKHHPEQPDCAACHMPTRNTSDISHEQVTDHNIQRVPPAAVPLRLADDELKPVGKVSAGDREFGLAYAQMAERGDRRAGEKALALLSKAEANGASDAVLHAQLGYLSQLSGQRDRAMAEYRMALEGDQYEPSALGNLAVLEASGGDPRKAISLLQRLVEADPSQTTAGLNLAFVECRVGRRLEATEVLHRLQEVNPDDPQVRTFLERGLYSGQRCALQ